MSGIRIYYLHPLLAGPVSEWSRHFQRCAAMGFTHVLSAPPFLPGRSGNLFVTADHDRLHPALRHEDAHAALQSVARAAADHGLQLLLDVVIDRVAVGSPSARALGEWHDGDADAPPDPRLPPADAGSVIVHGLGDPAVVAWWQSRLTGWLDIGIAGFRCVSAARVTGEVWTGLIAGARQHYPEAVFAADINEASERASRNLSSCGFDLASSSSWAWDFRADWFDADTRHAVAVGALLAMPELPFGPRLAATAPRPEARCDRALHFAATFGQSWLMPMGFEFMARRPLDPIFDRAASFERLAADPPGDLSDIIREVNRAQEEHAPAYMVSAPGERAVALLEEGHDARLLLMNASLDRPAAPHLRRLRPRLHGLVPMAEEVADLKPAETRLIMLQTPSPVRMAQADTQAKAAIAAPRLAIEAIAPAVDDGRFPVKRIVGETVEVSADIICDGHEALKAMLLWRTADMSAWTEIPMAEGPNDRWTASFALSRPGRHEFMIEAWKDVFGQFRYELGKKQTAGLDLSLELREGLALVGQAATRTCVPALHDIVKRLSGADNDARLAVLMAPETVELMARADARPFAIRNASAIAVDAERQAAAFASWYEMFPRSQSGTMDRHGTFDDVIARLPYVRDMGFDVLYFPPIHPIGRKNRKGRNNTLDPGPNDPGSPYAIGAAEGGHDAIHPELGTFDDFRRLLAAAENHGLEIALDFAIQCAPDHPWLREHPEWFDWRPDGTVKYAENPPKKYQDIVNVDFYADGARPSLWLALRDIVAFWVREGVRIFRVDNPHTKPLPFWEWMIGDIRSRHPDVIFLAEAFTRPKMMYRLAKVGFSQSYTYFTWRNTAWELREYLTELSTTAPKEFFRPHFFVNTPDINPIFLHDSGRAGFLLRAALAATLSGLWGVYNGYELCEARSLNNREEYLDSEKYQIRAWDYDAPVNIIAEIRQLNHIRRTNPALHSHLGVHFLTCSNEQVLCYAKVSPERDNMVIVAVSLDPHHAQDFDFEVAAASLGLISDMDLRAEDLMRGGVSIWRTGWRHLRLDPTDLPFALWRVRPTVEG